MGVETNQATPLEAKTFEDACCVEITDAMHGKDPFDVDVTVQTLAARMIVGAATTKSGKSVLMCPRDGCETTCELSVSRGQYQVSSHAVCMNALNNVR